MADPPNRLPPPNVAEIEVPTITIEEGKEVRVRKFQAEWDRIDEIIAWAYPLDYVSGQVYVRVPRLHYPGRPHLRMNRMVITPMDKDNITATDVHGVARTNAVKIELTYTTFKSDVLTVDVDTSAEFLKFPNIPSAKLKDVTTSPSQQMADSPVTSWPATDQVNCAGSAAPSPALSQFKLIPIVNWNITWHNVLQPPWEAMQAKTGMVNNHLFLTAPKECVLYMGAKITQKATPFGQLCFDITHKFSVRMIRYRTDPTVSIGDYPAQLYTIGAGLPGITSGAGVPALNFMGGQEQVAGWNHVLRPATDTCSKSWARVEPPPYESTSFRELFLPGKLDLGALFMAEIGINNF